jgi:DNA-directed RNA polymerase specialized sigma24 family protein
MNGKTEKEVSLSGSFQSEQIPVLKQSNQLFDQYVGYKVPIERDSVSIYPKMNSQESFQDFVDRIKRPCVEPCSVNCESKSVFDQYLNYKVPTERDSVSIYPEKTSQESFQDFVEKIKSFYAEQIKNTLLIDDVPINLMSQEQMAVAVALDLTGKKILGVSDRITLHNTLHESIKKLVYQLANKYAVNSIDKEDDLAQNCMKRIFSQLWRFDPKKGKFTTWIWYVCTSILNKGYHKGLRGKNIFVDEGHLKDEDGKSMFENLPDQPVEGVQHHECKNVLANEMTEAVKELARNNPERKEFIYELFGNPDNDDFTITGHLNISNAAKTIGMNYSSARSFFSSVIRPFFENKFERC